MPRLAYRTEALSHTKSPSPENRRESGIIPENDAMWFTVPRKNLLFSELCHAQSGPDDRKTQYVCGTRVPGSRRLHRLEKTPRIFDKPSPL
jgi:hypothetical protein